jgi:hypothetical protein
MWSIGGHHPFVGLQALLLHEDAKSTLKEVGGNCPDFRAIMTVGLSKVESLTEVL